MVRTQHEEVISQLNQRMADKARYVPLQALSHELHVTTHPKNKLKKNNKQAKNKRFSRNRFEVTITRKLVCTTVYKTLCSLNSILWSYSGDECTV